MEMEAVLLATKRVAGLDGVQVLPRIATPGSQRVTTPCRVFPPTLISTKLQIKPDPRVRYSPTRINDTEEK